MTGVLIDLDLESLPVLPQRGLELRHFLHGRCRILRTEQPEQRAAELVQQVRDGRPRQAIPRRRGAGGEGAVTVDGGIQVQLAGGKDRLPSAWCNSR